MVDRRGGGALPVEPDDWRFDPDADTRSHGGGDGARGCPADAGCGRHLTVGQGLLRSRRGRHWRGQQQDARRGCRHDQDGRPESDVTGYTDKAGDLATNEALAKSRSSAVRDALTAAGVAVVNIEMKPPTAASPHNTKAR
jgi:hypothetical protein